MTGHIPTVRKRVRYDDAITGGVNYNAMHDKSLYEVEYPDRTAEQLAANIIAENMLSQVESEGHHYQVLTGVIDHKKRDTRRWKLLVECKYRSVGWVP